METPAPAILFLCLGNICRSPLAEGAARDAFAAARIDARVDSAGTSDWHIGRPPDPRAIAEARRHGVDISGLAARQLGTDDFHQFDLILVADTTNLREARALQPPGSKAVLKLMRDVVSGQEGRAVADPYHGDAAGFAATWDEVKGVANALVTAYSSA